VKTVLTLASLCSLGVAFWAGSQGFLGVLTVGFLAFGFLLFVANLDHISEFKATGSGIEAKTRDVLKRAEHTLNELQSLARIVSETTLSLVKRHGRWGGYEDEEAERIKSAVLSVLADLKLSEAQQEEVLRDWHRFTEIDYAFYILGHSRIPEDFEDKDIHKEWKALRRLSPAATPDQLRAFLGKWQLLTPEREEQIKDYESYIKHRTHRRPDIWKQRESWGHLKKR